MLNNNNSSSSDCNYNNNEVQLFLMLNKPENVGKVQFYVLSFFFVRQT